MNSRRYGGATADQRRAGRRTALLEAALDLLGTEGLQATTLRAVCARAGLNPRYFYESFTDLDALLTEVYDRIAAETADAAARGVAGAGPDADLRSTVRAAASAVLALGRDDPRKVRVVLIEASASPVLRARRRVTRRHYAELVAGYARSFYDIPPGADAQLHFTATMLVAGWNENLIAWLEGDLRAPASDLADLFADAADALAAPYASVRRRSRTARPEAPGRTTRSARPAS